MRCDNILCFEALSAMYKKLNAILEPVCSIA